LANGVLTLLRDEVLTATLSRRGFDRVCSRYTQSMCLARYRALLGELAASGSNVVPLSRSRPHSRSRERVA